MPAMRVSLTARYVSHPTIHFGSGHARSRHRQLGLARTPTVYHRPRVARLAAPSVASLRVPTSRFSFPSRRPRRSDPRTAAPLCRSGSSALAAHSRAVAALRNARATSAGGVVHRSNDGRTEIALVHRRRPPLWALPKGTPDAGETREETALRETREETGLRVELEGPIGDISYVFVRGRTRFHKTVHFFLMRAVGGDLADHRPRVRRGRLVPADEALSLMTHATERSVVEDALRILGERRSRRRLAEVTSQ